MAGRGGESWRAAGGRGRPPFRTAPGPCRLLAGRRPALAAMPRPSPSAALGPPRFLRRFDPHNAGLRLFMGSSPSRPPPPLLLCASAARWPARAAPCGRARAPARRRRPRRAADGLRAPAPRELERSRRRAALRGRSDDRRRERERAARLAFGSWLAPADAAAVEGALEQLAARRGLPPDARARSRSASSTWRAAPSAGGRSCACATSPATGRAAAARATSAKRAATCASATTLLDAIPHPLWIRDAEDRLLWANQAYLRAVEAKNLDDARSRALELLDRADPRGGASASARPAALRGPRHAVSPAQRARARRDRAPDAGGSAGIAVDVSELEAVRTDLQRQMEAHVRTLDQLPTAVAIFDGEQRLVFHNAAYQPALGPRSAFLALPRRTARCSTACAPPASCPSRPISAPGRRTSSPAYRAVEPQRDLVAPARPAHPARRHRQPEPAGRRHLSLRRRERARPARIAGTTRSPACRARRSTP